MNQMDTDKEGLKLDTSKERPFFLTIRFNRNLMNKNNIGRARLLPSRGGPYHVRLASYTRPDPGAPRVGCFQIKSSETIRLNSSVDYHNPRVLEPQRGQM